MIIFYLPFSKSPDAVFEVAMVDEKAQMTFNGAMSIAQVLAEIFYESQLQVKV